MLMQDGPMGLVLSDRRTITSTAPGGQAARGGIEVDDVLTAINGAALEAGLTHEETIGRIKACGRPLRLTFVRPSSAAAAAAAAAPAAPTAFAKLFNPKVPNAAQVAQGVKAAGSFMKGLLGAGVQAIAGVDKIIGNAVVGAVDASTRQASVRCVAGLARGRARRARAPARRPRPCRPPAHSPALLLPSAPPPLLPLAPRSKSLPRRCTLRAA